MTKLARVVRSIGSRVGAISKRSGISVQRLGELADESPASIKEAQALAHALKVPLAALLERGDAGASVEFKFRQASKYRENIDVPFYLEDMAGRVSGLLEVLNSCPDRSPISTAWKSKVPKDLGAEELADWCRSSLLNVDAVSPIPALPRLVSGGLGVTVVRVPYSEIEGASAIVEGVPVIFVSGRFPPRMLFTVAHELGHLLAHHGTGDFVAIDEVVDQSRAESRKEESFADLFASALLMPPAGVGVALKVIRQSIGVHADAIGDVEILYLSRLFCVSFQVAAIRCERLGLVPRGGAQSLYEHLVQNHQSPEKRADELGLPGREAPSFQAISEPLFEVVSECIDAGKLSVGRVIENLRLPITDLMAANRAALH